MMNNPTFKLMRDAKLDYKSLVWYVEDNRLLILARDRKDLVMHVN